MDSIGLMGILPPLLAIILALITKDVIFSLFTGVIAGALIVSGGNPVTSFALVSNILAENMGDPWNIRVVLFCALLGGLVGLLSRSGAVHAFGAWATQFIKSKRSAQMYTIMFSFIIFIDDFFNIMAIGPVMRPLIDKNGVSRAKLAYILDSTAAPLVVLAPISSWVVTIISQIRQSSGFETLGVDEMSFFIRMLPSNLYAILALILVLIVASSQRDFGPMLSSEVRASKGEGHDSSLYGAVAQEMEIFAQAKGAKWFDMLIPIGVLVVVCIISFPYTAYMANDGQAMTLAQAFSNADASIALFFGVIITLALTYIYLLIRRILTLGLAGDALVDGIKSMTTALVILALAWSIGSIIREPLSNGGLGLPIYFDMILRQMNMPLWLLPIGLYILSSGIAFSTGTSWGTFAIMIPLALPVAISLAHLQGLAIEEVITVTAITVGAVLSGAVFGDHASPISSTTILSSAGAGCHPIEHVSTQLPYALLATGSALVGIIVAGVTLNQWLALGVSILVLVVSFILISANATKQKGIK
jgi:tetracycline resistance efflux pump